MKKLLVFVTTLFLIIAAVPAHAGAVYLRASNCDDAAQLITAWEKQNPTARIVTVSTKSTSNGWLEGVLVVYRVKAPKTPKPAAAKK